MTAAQRIQPPRPGALIALVASLLAAPLATSQTGADDTVARDAAIVSAEPWEILAVDGLGRPVAGVELELIDTVSTAVTRALGGTRIATDADGKIKGAQDPPYVLDIVSRDPRWSVAFVHGKRTPDDTLGDDLLGRPLLRIDTRGSVLCILEATGTIHLRVADAGPTDRFHVCFVDDRPEPASHRMARASASFDGAECNISIPAGRGTLYVARDGSLGSPILAQGRPLLVAVVPGRTTDVAVRFFDGPTTTLMAPFGTIPFKHLEALTPDGERVVADLPFLSSPLRIPFALPVAEGTPHDPQHPIGFRLPKHLIRAADIPAPNALERPTTDEPHPLRPEVETAPVELIFTVDLGSKVRLPEVAAGWTTLVQSGLLILGGSGSDGPLLDGLRHLPGGIDLAALQPPKEKTGQEADDSWSVTLRVVDGAAKPAAFREVLVSAGRSPAIRAATDALGALQIDGIVGDSVIVAALHSQGERIQIARAGDRDRERQPELVIGTPTRAVTGSWTTDVPGHPAPGSVLALVPADTDEAAARRPFGTHAYQIAITDTHGSFDFGEVPRGDYVIRTNSGNEHAISVTSKDGAPLILQIVGEGSDAVFSVSQ